MPRVDTSRNDDILLLGMNPHPEGEAQALQGNNPKAHVTTVRDTSWETAGNDQIKAKTAAGQTQVYDLQTEAGVRGFVETLGLPLTQSREVATVLAQGGADARDELAQLAQVWARAEKGGVVPSRLVLSAHSIGPMALWGEKNGALDQGIIGRLAQAMPKAAAQVEDLYVAACYNGNEPSMDAWRAAFPNLKTMAAYTGSAPGAFVGSTAHMARWEQATRGEVETLRADLQHGLLKAAVSHGLLW